jgi:hypothetical protein
MIDAPVKSYAGENKNLYDNLHAKRKRIKAMVKKNKESKK